MESYQLLLFYSTIIIIIIIISIIIIAPPRSQSVFGHFISGECDRSSKNLLYNIIIINSFYFLPDFTVVGTIPLLLLLLLLLLQLIWYYYNNM